MMNGAFLTIYVFYERLSRAPKELATAGDGGKGVSNVILE